MQMTTNPTAKLVVPGVALAAAFTMIIAATASNLTAFSIVGPTVAFAYPWRLAEPTAVARLTPTSILATIRFCRRSTIGQWIQPE